MPTKVAKPLSSQEKKGREAAEEEQTTEQFNPELQKLSSVFDDALKEFQVWALFQTCLHIN